MLSIRMVSLVFGHTALRGNRMGQVYRCTCTYYLHSPVPERWVAWGQPLWSSRAFEWTSLPPHTTAVVMNLHGTSWSEWMEIDLISKISRAGSSTGRAYVLLCPRLAKIWAAGWSGRHGKLLKSRDLHYDVTRAMERHNGFRLATPVATTWGLGLSRGDRCKVLFIEFQTCLKCTLNETTVHCSYDVIPWSTKRHIKQYT